MSELERKLEKTNEKGVIISNRVMLRYEDGWHHLVSIEMMDKIRNEDYEEYNDIRGKYLFYSTGLLGLIGIGTQEIVAHDFHVAKVNSRLLGTNTEYVLCLYYRDDSRKHELASRCKTDYPDAKYRYWKSDESTRRGQYSDEFLSKLDPETRSKFIEGGKQALTRSRRNGGEGELQAENERLKQLIGELTIANDAFKKSLQGEKGRW